MNSRSILILLIICNAYLVQAQASNKTLDYGYGNKDAPVITIGTQIWMAKNLNIISFRNGDVIPEAKTAEEWKNAAKNAQPVWCHYQNDVANGNKFGKLYNWYAVSDPRGLAPKGWIIPNQKEWSTLVDYLGGMKKGGTSAKAKSGWNKNGNNSSGFSGLPSGARFETGVFSSSKVTNSKILSGGFWWSVCDPAKKSGKGACEELEAINVQMIAWYLESNNDTMEDLASSGINWSDKGPTTSPGYSVRCVKD